MADLAIDESLNVYIDAGGNLGFVEGRQAFEQRVGVRLTDRYYDLIGNTDRQEVIERIRTEAQRIADAEPSIDSMPTFDIQQSSDKQNELIVTILYDTGDSTELTI